MSDFVCKQVQNCFSKTAIYQYRLNFKIDDRFLRQLEAAGTVKCQWNFPRPYFHVSLPDGTELKGVIGDVALKVVFPFASVGQSKIGFEQLLAEFVHIHQNGKE